MTFLIISCSASDIFALVAFLAGFVEWKDQPEFNLKKYKPPCMKVLRDRPARQATYSAKILL